MDYKQVTMCPPRLSCCSAWPWTKLMQFLIYHFQQFPTPFATVQNECAPLKKSCTPVNWLTDNWFSVIWSIKVQELKIKFSYFLSWYLFLLAQLMIAFSFVVTYFYVFPGGWLFSQVCVWQAARKWLSLARAWSWGLTEFCNESIRMFIILLEDDKLPHVSIKL